MKEPVLFAFWLACFEALAHYCVFRSVDNGLRLVLVGGSLIWTGLLIAISFTESWLKFRSSILERQVALDVGRIVFDGLNTLEIALCISMFTVLYRFQPYQEKTWNIPLTMGLILLFQVFYLTPRLELRTFFIAAEELAKKKHASRADEKAYKEYKAITTLRVLPPQWLHHLYVVLEIVKVGMLLKYAEILML